MGRMNNSILITGRQAGTLNLILTGALVNKYATQSLTFRGLAIVLIGYLLTWAGFSVQDADVSRLIDGFSALVVAVGAIATAKGRIRATRPIAGFNPPRHK